jgi:hypothetical protein
LVALLSPVFGRAQVAQGLVRSLLVVVTDPGGDGTFGFLEVSEVVEPGALLFETAKEPLDHAILLRCIRCDELLVELVVPAGPTEAAALEDKPIITSEYWGLTLGTKRAEA